MNRTRPVMAISVIAGAAAMAAATASHGPRTPMDSGDRGKRAPIVVELFTSEGCSSCPPADAVLARLKRDQPVEGAQVIALSEHVDYWNNSGWKDAFSAKLFSLRQAAYMHALNLDQVYTPQAVVDGKVEFVGSDQQRAETEIARAARTPKADVRISADKSTSGNLSFRVQIDNVPEMRPGDSADVLLAITEDNLRSSVIRGENAGRTLEHVAVVRELRRIGSIVRGDPFSASVPLVINSAWKRRDLSIVVFTQEHIGGRILGAATIPLQ